LVSLLGVGVGGGGCIFLFLREWLFGVVLWVFLLFGGFFWFVLVLFWYCLATE
jgi:hypothetical protein